MTISELCERAYAQAKAKGFHDVSSTVDRRLMLIVGELSEAHEELRKGHGASHIYYQADGKPEGFAFEIADTVIRIADMAESMGIHLEEAIRQKLEYNATRPHMHGKAF